MSTRQLVQGAAAELYAAAPADFIARRAELVAAARSAGENAAARQIGALRKPTQSAWVINQLVRAAPDAPERLSDLGRRLRRAQRALDGAALRELSAQRRELVDELTRQALGAAGLARPGAALREEVATTLAAALADPGVADQVAGGALERPARSDGFGDSAGAPVLTLVRSPAPEDKPVRERTAARERKAARDQAAKDRDEQRRLAHREAVSRARQAAATADREARSATKAEERAAAAVTKLEDELEEARHELSAARSAARQARARARQARESLARADR